MSDTVIHVENLGKRYRIGEREQYLALRDILARALSAPFRFFKARKPSSANGDPTHIWALKDASFEIHQGEVVGIIGRNGAGKTTLLKILARVTQPTTGHAEVRGRIGSLLEVGTGFHPELTGRENTYLNGAILGMSKKEVDRKFDEIVAYAEIEKFIDTPVKHYSSGMYVRLAFAVAAHLDSEILLVDEVLAVGDVRFQEKCIRKVSDVARSGRTVLFVSHSMASITSLCRSVLLLHNGHVKARGPTDKVVEEYLAPLADSPATVDLTSVANRAGSGEVKFTRVELRNHAGQPCSTFEYGEDLYFDLRLESASRPRSVFCAILIRTLMGVPVLHLFSGDDPGSGLFTVNGMTQARCILKHCRLYPGVYVVSLWTGPSAYLQADHVADALQFRVEQGELAKCGFDLNWTHGVFHGETAWQVTTPVP
jgi:lipopolysaccharide transport system ATP-binding protein